MYAVIEYWPALQRGLLTTLAVTALGFTLAVLFGFVLALLRLSASKIVSNLCTAVVEFFRGTSALVQLFWVFYALPLLPIDLAPSPFVAAMVVFSLNGGSYVSEIVRGAVQSIPKGQRDAACSLGMSRRQELRIVVVPQAIHAMLPPLANIAIDILKASALVSVIGLQDLTFWINTARASTGESMSFYGVALVVYFCVSVGIAVTFGRLETMTPLGRVQRRTRAASREHVSSAKSEEMTPDAMFGDTESKKQIPHTISHTKD